MPGIVNEKIPAAPLHVRAAGEERYLTIFESLPEPVFVLDRSGRLENCNAAARELFGEQADLCHLTLPAWLAEKLAELDGAGDGATVPVEMQTPRGIRSFNLQVREPVDGTGRATATVAILHDVSAERESQRQMDFLRHQMAKQAALLDAILSSSPEHFYMNDREGRYLYVSQRAADALGIGQGEFIGRTWRDVDLPEKTMEPYERKLREVCAAGRPMVGGMVLPTLEGRRFFEYSINPVIGPEGGVEATVTTARDVTIRKETERKLLQSRAELARNHEELRGLFLQVEKVKKEWEQTMDCIGGMVILADNEGRIKRCNLALARFTGHETSALLGRDWKELFHEHGLKGGELFVPGMELYHEPSARWFVYNAYPFTDLAGYEVTGVVITVNDTTELKKTAEALGIAYNELKSTQAKVLQQEKMASIGQLAAGVAHEINNPIGFISSNLGTLLKYVGRFTGFIDAQDTALAALPPQEAERLAVLRRTLKLDYIKKDVEELITESMEGAERVRKIVADLKSFSRVDEAEYKVADINQCIESTLNIVWNELKYKATVLRKLESLPPTRCYPQQLNQVFMNLLVNAGHAIDKKGEITIASRAENGEIFVSVSDTGCGIEKANQSRIFEPFFTTKDVGKGTGLGLSITYDIVKKHNGEITVESEPGKGTTFTVRLPVVEEG